MTTATCPHDPRLTPAACVDCMNEGNLPPAPKPEQPRVLGGPFAARFDGQCSDCNTGIHRGQQIVRMSNDTYRHALCEGIRGL